MLPQQPLGSDVDFDLQHHSADLTVLHSEEESTCSVLDLGSSRIHSAELNCAYLLQLLRSDPPSRLA